MLILMSQAERRRRWEGSAGVMLAGWVRSGGTSLGMGVMHVVLRVVLLHPPRVAHLHPLGTVVRIHLLRRMGKVPVVHSSQRGGAPFRMHGGALRTTRGMLVVAATVAVGRVAVPVSGVGRVAAVRLVLWSDAPGLKLPEQLRPGRLRGWWWRRLDPPPLLHGKASVMLA